MSVNILANDLDHVLTHTSTLWEELRNQCIFMTGGTGFFGCWLLESFIWINSKLNLNAKMTVLTRNKAAFAKKCPHLAETSCVSFIEGDVKDLTYFGKNYSYVIHAATDASAHLNETNPLLMLDTIIEGTRQTLEFARLCGAKKFLLTSSGAVYGRQPPELSHIPEDFSSHPSLHDTRSAYAVGKCTAEHLAALYAKQYGLDVKIARCFAFIGPYLPLDIHFAIGNFIRDGLKGGPILIQGDGSPYRSYLYTADLVIWLWTILLRGKTLTPYNVGSDEAFSIEQIAHLVANSFDPMIKVEVMKTREPQKLPERYIPDTTRARKDLGLQVRIGLEQSIVVTKQWHNRHASEGWHPNHLAREPGCLPSQA